METFLFVLIGVVWLVVALGIHAVLVELLDYKSHEVILTVVYWPLWPVFALVRGLDYGARAAVRAIARAVRQ